MVKIKLSNGTEYEVLPITAVYPSYASNVRNRMEIHMSLDAMTDAEFIALFSDKELTKKISIINTETDKNITYEGYNEPFSVGVSRYDTVVLSTGEPVTEYHLVANLEQLTYQEADVRRMKELLEQMSAKA
mgnify:FL=1